MKRALMGLFCVLLSCGVLAAGPSAVRKRTEVSMLVTGSILVSPDGGVQSYTVDQADKLPATVVDLLGKNVPTWKFEPVTVDGKPVLAKAKMSVRIVGKRVDDSHDAISIAGAQFGENDRAAGESISYKTREAPAYPRMAVESRVPGTVYLVLRVDRQGQVANAVAEQVNLEAYGNDFQMDRFRQVLADATLKAATHWTFTIPTAGKHAADDYWVVRVPVHFELSPAGQSSPRDAYGHWHVYVPGPRQPVPWIENKLIAGSADAMPAGGIQQLDQALHLTTPLGSI